MLGVRVAMLGDFVAIENLLGPISLVCGVLAGGGGSLSGGVPRLEERYVSVALSNYSSEIFTFVSFVYTDLESSIRSVISVELER